MIDPATLFTYIVIVLSFVFIPGPATLLTVARATSSGTHAGIATGAGIAAGDIIHTLLAVVGISAIIATSAILFSAIKYLGAAYLIYLGIIAICKKSPPQLGDMNKLDLTPRQAFNQAIFAELLNPKTALFFLAFLPQFVNPDNGSVAVQLMVLGVLFACLGLISTIIFAISAGRLGKFLRRNPSVVKWQGKIIGGIYCTLGLRLALQER